jgi:hypothetical protein
MFREAIARIRAKQPKGRTAVQVNNQAQADAVRRRWKTEDSINTLTAQTMAIADAVEELVPGAADHMKRVETRKAIAAAYADDPGAWLIFLHGITSGLYGLDTATAFLEPFGTDNPFTVEPEDMDGAIATFSRLTMPALYARRPRAEGYVDQGEAREVADRLREASDYFAGWTVADINPAAIAAGIMKRVWTPIFAERGVDYSVDGDLPVATFKSADWQAPWRMESLLFSGLTAATVGDWSDPCPRGLQELDAILTQTQDNFGPRQWVLELGAYNRSRMKDAKEVPIRFTSTVSQAAIGGES